MAYGVDDSAYNAALAAFAPNGVSLAPSVAAPAATAGAAAAGSAGVGASAAMSPFLSALGPIGIAYTLANAMGLFSHVENPYPAGAGYTGYDPNHAAEVMQKNNDVINNQPENILARFGSTLSHAERMAYDYNTPEEREAAIQKLAHGDAAFADRLRDATKIQLAAKDSGMNIDQFLEASNVNQSVGQITNDSLKQLSQTLKPIQSTQTPQTTQPTSQTSAPQGGDSTMDVTNLVNMMSQIPQLQPVMNQIQSMASQGGQPLGFPGGVTPTLNTEGTHVPAVGQDIIQPGTQPGNQTLSSTQVGTQQAPTQGPQMNDLLSRLFDVISMAGTANAMPQTPINIPGPGVGNMPKSNTRNLPDGMTGAGYTQNPLQQLFQQYLQQYYNPTNTNVNAPSNAPVSNFSNTANNNPVNTLTNNPQYNPSLTNNPTFTNAPSNAYNASNTSNPQFTANPSNVNNPSFTNAPGFTNSPSNTVSPNISPVNSPQFTNAPQYSTEIRPEYTPSNVNNPTISPNQTLSNTNDIALNPNISPSISSTNNPTISPSFSTSNTNMPTISPSISSAFTNMPTISPSNTNTYAPGFNPTNTNTNTFNPNITVNPATVPNSYQFNNGVPPLQGSQGNQGGFWNNMNPQNPDPNAGVSNNTGSTPPGATPTSTSSGSGSDMFSQLMQMFGIQNPAQAGLGAGILGIGGLMNKDVKLPDFWSDRGVQDLANWGNSANHPMDPNVDAAIQRSMDIQNEQQLRNLRDVYKNLRPGTDYTTDTNYQRDLGNLNRSMSMNTADAKAGSQLASNAQNIGIKSNLAEGSVGQGRIQGLFDTQKNTNQNQLFGNLGSAFINSSLQKPAQTYNQAINIPKAP